MDYYEFYDHYPEPFMPSDPSLLSALVGILGLFILVALIIMAVYAVTAYVLNGLSFYHLAKRRNFKYPWLAWIPLCRQYLLGALINDQVKIGSLILPHAAIALPLVTIGATFTSLLTSSIPYVGFLFSLIILILESIYLYAAYYRLYKIYYAKNAALFTTLSIIFPICAPFFLFALRNRTPDFTEIAPMKPEPFNPRSILALGLSIATVLSALMLSGGASLYLGACTLIFAILSLQEQKAQHQKLTLPVIALVLAIIGILLPLLIPRLSAGFWLNQPFGWHHLFNDFYDYQLFNDSPYPFI